MFQWLVIAAVIAAVASEPVADQAAETLSIHDVYSERFDDRGGLRDRGRDHERGDPDYNNEHNGPKIARLVDPSNIVHGPHNAREKEIVLNAYSPDYYEPTWILDYRYLKTGGRDYIRSDGGQIMILPKNVHSNEKKEHKNFDELLEFLRLKQLAESEAHRLHAEKRHHGQDREEERRPESYASREKNQGRDDAYGWQKNWAGFNTDH